MKSIRLFLLLAIIAIVTLVSFISLLKGYDSSIKQAQQSFDQRLQNLAVLFNVAHFGNQQPNPPQTMTDHNGDVFFQIHDYQGNLLQSYSKGQSNYMPEHFATGFYDVNHQRQRWRLYMEFFPQHAQWVVVAERYDIRYNLAERVAMESVYPVVIGVPIMAVIIWLAISFGLAPLNKLAKQLENKQVNDLTSLELEPLPNELVLLVETMNDLLLRLDNAFQREQRFASDAAHELRTPISILKVHIHNLKQTALSEQTDIDLLEQGFERLSHSVEQILALYRTTPDKAAYQFEKVDLYLLAQQVIVNLYPQIEAKQQTIALEGKSQIVMGNPFAINTLLMNLLTNANKYTPEGGQILVNIAKNKQLTALTVEDSGSGIPEGSYQRVFERFYRLHGDRHSSKQLGSGLGLAIVKHIVDIHGATISLTQSRFETGLKVNVTFPLLEENK
jgi:two-component system sensor histidine kinase QseC